MMVPLSAGQASKGTDAVRAMGLKIPETFRRAIHSLVATVLPSRCCGCGRLFNPPPIAGLFPGAAAFSAVDAQRPDDAAGNRDGLALNRGPLPAVAADILSPWVCPDCVGGWRPIDSPMCRSCGIPFKSREGADHICGQCLQRPMNFRMARASAVYSPLAMAFLHAFKYSGKIQLATPLGAMLASAFISYWEGADVDLFLPVPLHRRRFRRRGFNQAYLLAEELESRLDRMARIRAVPAVERGALRRVRCTASQTGLRRKGRLANIRGAFEVPNPAKVRDRRILLIDDIYTTGATVNECARMLLAAGAARIDVLTVARAV